MTKLCPRGKAAAKRKFKVYPSAYANAYASKICAGKIKDPSGVKRKDFKGPKPAGAKKGALMIMIAVGKKKKVQKKMGGGMTAGSQSALGRLQKARMMNKGGDANTMIKKSGIKDPKVIATAHSLKNKDRLTESDIKKAKDMIKNPRGKALNITKRSIDILKSSKKQGGMMKYNKGGGADFINTVKPRKRGNPAVVTNSDERAKKKGIIRKANKYSQGGDAKLKKVITGLKKASKTHASQAKTLSTIKLRGGGAAIRGTNFKGVF